MLVLSKVSMCSVRERSTSVPADRVTESTVFVSVQTMSNGVSHEIFRVLF
jgi:hypothetical protein